LQQFQSPDFMHVVTPVKDDDVVHAQLFSTHSTDIHFFT
jgi:hypothetical protein